MMKINIFNINLLIHRLKANFLKKTKMLKKTNIIKKYKMRKLKQIKIMNILKY